MAAYCRIGSSTPATVLELDLAGLLSFVVHIHLLGGIGQQIVPVAKLYCK